MVKIYSDGGARPNPGFGACAFVVIDTDDTVIFESVSIAEHTTNNIMELQAVINALSICKDNNINNIEVYTDSNYVKSGITDWINKWYLNGWKTATGQPVKNKNLWIKLSELHNELSPKWYWTKGHDINKWNNHVDELCSKAIVESKNI